MDAQGALAPSIALAKALDARLTMLVVVQPPLFPLFMADVDRDQATANARAAYVGAFAQRQAQNAKVSFRVVTQVGRFVERTLAFLQTDSTDLLILGNRGVPSLFIPFLDGAVDVLIRKSSCSVHVVRHDLSRRAA